MKIIVVCLVFFGVVFVAYVHHLEKSSLFYPEKILTASPQQLGLPYEDIYVKTEDGLTLHGWFIKRDNAIGTMLFLHGNAGNISGRLERIACFHAIGLAVLIIDYRGFGQSEGAPTEEGMYKDVVAAYDYLLKREDVDPQSVVVYGASLGGAAAVDLATKRDVPGLIIDSSFSSAVDMAAHFYPFIPSFLVKLKLDSARKVADIKAPKLIIHSPDDTIVPFALGKKLFDAAAEPKQFLKINGSHLDGHIYAQDAFIGGIRTFVEGVND